MLNLLNENNPEHSIQYERNRKYEIPFLFAEIVTGLCALLVIANVVCRYVATHFTNESCSTVNWIGIFAKLHNQKVNGFNLR